MTDLLVLSGRLDVRAVADLHAQLSARMDQDVQVDLSGVTHLGALCLQTLLACSIALRAQGHRMICADLAEDVAAQMESMGVSATHFTGGTT